MLLPQEVEDFNFAAYSPAINIYGTNSDHYTAMFEQGQIGMPLEASSSLTVGQKQKFTIHEISPDWGYAHEATKVSFYISSKRIDLFVFYIFVTH